MIYNLTIKVLYFFSIVSKYPYKADRIEYLWIFPNTKKTIDLHSST